jgi:hypothetical protein
VAGMSGGLHKPVAVGVAGEELGYVVGVVEVG